VIACRESRDLAQLGRSREEQRDLFIFCSLCSLLFWQRKDLDLPLNIVSSFTLPNHIPFSSTHSVLLDKTGQLYHRIYHFTELTGSSVPRSRRRGGRARRRAGLPAHRDWRSAVVRLVRAGQSRYYGHGSGRRHVPGPPSPLVRLVVTVTRDSRRANQPGLKFFATDSSYSDRIIESYVTSESGFKSVPVARPRPRRQSPSLPGACRCRARRVRQSVPMPVPRTASGLVGLARGTGGKPPTHGDSATMLCQ
jgi:hypothetical protein